MDLDLKKLGIPHLQIIVDQDEIQQDAMKILKEIRPSWEEEKIRFKLLTDGITNKLIGCKHEDLEDEEAVLIRVYGHKTDLLIDRKAETRNIIILNRAGLAPNLYATFENGLAYRFIPGCTLNCDTVRDPKYYKLVAKMMAKLHKIGVEDGKFPKPFIWDKSQKFMDLVPDVFSDPEKNSRYLEYGISKSNIEKEYNEIKSVLVNVDSPVVFAHNDLLLGNVIYTEKTNTISFIDFEYAGFNYQAYDIANHFAEFVGLDISDYSRFPDQSLQEDWIKTYLTEFYGRDPTDEEVYKLYVQANKFVLLTHLFWGIWSLIQTEHSNIDFDYLHYGNLRFKEYFAKKEQILSLKITR